MNTNNYKNVWLGFLALTIVFLFACKKNDPGGVQPDDPTTTDYVKNMHHPCMLHTDADFTFVKSKIQASAQPWTNAYNHLTASKHAASSWTPQPVVKLARLDQTNWQSTYPNDWSNYTNLMYDAASAYQLALRWKLSGDDTYAVTAINILNSWAKKCTGYIVNSTGDFIDPNEYLIAIQIHQLANAAEILRASDKWSSTDFEAYKKWMVDVFYKQASRFLQTHNNTACSLHYWLNWDLANMTAILSIGILTDDNYKINEAIKYFKIGIGAGGIENAVPYLHKDPDSNEMLGQCNESGRDQGHATLDVSLMGVFCQMAKNVGEDLFTYDSNRAQAMCEYTGKFNIGSTESNYMMSNFTYDISQIPFTHYTNCEYDHPAISSDSRGTVRPAWELIHRLSSDYGLPDTYTKQWVAKMRENASRGFCDGGSGDYGPNSGGYDQLGCGTLMFAKE